MYFILFYLLLVHNVEINICDSSSSQSSSESEEICSGEASSSNACRLIRPRATTSPRPTRKPKLRPTLPTVEERPRAIENNFHPELKNLLQALQSGETTIQMKLKEDYGREDEEKVENIVKSRKRPLKSKEQIEKGIYDHCCQVYLLIRTPKGTQIAPDFKEFLNQIFYIGEGLLNRCVSHVGETLLLEPYGNTYKTTEILRTWTSGDVLSIVVIKQPILKRYAEELEAGLLMIYGPGNNSSVSQGVLTNMENEYTKILHHLMGNDEEKKAILARFAIRNLLKAYKIYSTSSNRHKINIIHDEL